MSKEDKRCVFSDEDLTGDQYELFLEEPNYIDIPGFGEAAAAKVKDERIEENPESLCALESMIRYKSRAVEINVPCFKCQSKVSFRPKNEG